MFSKLMLYVCMIALMFTDAQAAIIPYNKILGNKILGRGLKSSVRHTKGKFCKIIQPLFAATGKSMPGGWGNILNLARYIWAGKYFIWTLSRALWLLLKFETQPKLI